MTTEGAMTEQLNRRAEDKNMQVLATKIEGLTQDMGEMKHGIAKMADALTKLTIVEERQTQTILAQERAFKALERVEERQRQHELQEMAVFGEFVESVRQWGRAERAKLGGWHEAVPTKRRHCPGSSLKRPAWWIT